MAYSPTTWVNGSTPINATNMNHIESGIASKYEKAATGIPESDLAAAVTEKFGTYPVVATLTAWNQQFNSASAITPNVTLPAPTGTKTEEIRYVFTAASTGATFTAPSGYILTDDKFASLSAGNSIVKTNLTAGSIYEYSFMVLDSSHIGMNLIKEWKTV